MQAASEETNDVYRTKSMSQAFMAKNFEGGLHFQLIKGENGQVLKVTVAAAGGGFNHPVGGMPQEKIYIIPEGGNVIDAIAVALVEERIK